MSLHERMLKLEFAEATALLGSGIYVLGYDDEVVYVGKSMALARRIGDHVGSPGFPFNSVYFLPVAPEDLSTFESFLILKFNPRYNSESPMELSRRVKGGLVGKYNVSARRRLAGIMGRQALNYDDLANLDMIDQDWIAPYTDDQIEELALVKSYLRAVHTRNNKRFHQENRVIEEPIKLVRRRI